MKKIDLVTNIIINEKDEILVIYKDTSNHHYPISGKVERGEDLILAAKREIFEETTLKAVNTHMITKCHQFFENDKEINSTWFLTTWFSGEIEKDYREGTLSWVNVEDIDTLDFLEGDREIIVDFLTDNLKESYEYKYDENRVLIND